MGRTRKELSFWDLKNRWQTPAKRAWARTALASCGVGEATRAINSTKVLPTEQWLPSYVYPGWGRGCPSKCPGHRAPAPVGSCTQGAGSVSSRTSLQPLHLPPPTLPCPPKPQWHEAHRLSSLCVLVTAKARPGSSPGSTHY